MLTKNEKWDINVFTALSLMFICIGMMFFYVFLDGFLSYRLETFSGVLLALMIGVSAFESYRYLKKADTITNKQFTRFYYDFEGDY